MRPFNLYYSPPITVEIKYGMTVPTANQKSTRPTMLDHFRVTTRERAGSNLMQHADIHEKIGPEPKSVKIRLLSDDPEENFSLFRSWYHKGSLLCGSVYGEETAKRFVETADGRIKKLDQPNEEFHCHSKCGQWERDLCSLSGNLYFRLDPSYGVDSNALGVLRVKSIHALRLITASLNILKNETNGVLANIPLQIQIHIEVKKDQTGQSRKIPMISIAPGVDIDSFKDSIRTETLRRAEFFEIRNNKKHENFEDIAIRGALSDVQHRSSIFTDIEEDVSIEELETETKIEYEEVKKKDAFVIPDNIKALISKAKFTQNQFNSYIPNHMNEETGEPNWDSFSELLNSRIKK
jgi:hypothetical protein